MAYNYPNTGYSGNITISHSSDNQLITPPYQNPVVRSDKAYPFKSLQSILSSLQSHCRAFAAMALLLLASVPAYAQVGTNQNINWTNTTKSRYWNMCGDSGNPMPTQTCDACSYYYTISDASGANGTDATGWLTFKAPATCKLKVTLSSTYHFGYRGNGNRDHLYVSESTSGSTQDNTGSASRDWYYDDVSDREFTTTNAGAYVTIYFNNGANGSGGGGNDSRYSTFTITVECFDCLDCDESFNMSNGLSKTINCGTTYCFYDDGGPNNNYNNTNGDQTATFTSNGDITLTFSSFRSRNADNISVYDGGTSGTRLIYQHTGNGTLPDPSSVTATSGTMTVVWHNADNNTRAGWFAIITASGCTTPSCTTDPAFDNCPDELESGTPWTPSWNTSATPSNWQTTNATRNGYSGVITAGATIGTATVSAQVAASGIYCEGTMTCTFNVVCNTSKTLSLSSTSGTVVAGNDITATITNTTGQNITWSSDNTGIATASQSGNTLTIHGVSAGQTTIHGRIDRYTTGGVTYCAQDVTYNVTVTAPATTCDEEILLNSTTDGTTKEIECGTTYCFYDSGGENGNYDDGQDYSITFTSTGNITIDFSSFRSEGTYDYMYIYDGTMSGTILLNEHSGNGRPNPTSYTATSGEMTITWYSDSYYNSNRSGWAAEITATGCCTRRNDYVHVTAPAPLTCPVTLNPEGTVQLTGTLDAGHGAGAESWRTSDNGVATVTNGLVTAVATGTAEIIYTRAANGGYCAASDTCRIIVPCPAANQYINFEDFVGATNHYTDSGLPTGWDRYFEDPSSGLIPHVIDHTANYVQPCDGNNAIILTSGPNSGYQYGPAIAIMPPMNVTTGSMSFSYRYDEDAFDGNDGVLEVGYVDVCGTFYTLSTPEKTTTCKTHHFNISSALPAGARLAFKYLCTTTGNDYTYYCVTIDDICVPVATCNERPGSFHYTTTSVTTVAGTPYTNSTLVNETGASTITYTICPSGAGATIDENGEVTTTAGLEGTFTVYATIPASNGYCDTSTSYTLNIGDGCVQVGNGTSNNSYAPIYSYYTGYYSYSQQLYTAGEIEGAGGCKNGKINSIKLYYTKATNLTIPIEVYIGQTNGTNVAGDWISDAGLTLVYTSPAGGTTFSEGWVELAFTNAYEWDGTSNILIAIRTTGTASVEDAYFQSTYNSSAYYTRYYYSSSSITLDGNKVPTSYTDYRYYRPNIKFCMICCTPRSGNFEFCTSSVNVTTSTPDFSVQLTNTLDPSGTVSYNNSNPAIATFDESTGTVHPVANGSTTITATVAADDPYCGYTTSFRVNVGTPGIGGEECAQIGNGSNHSSGSYGGISGGVFTYFNNYAYTQQVYTASELSSGGACAGKVTKIMMHYYDDNNLSNDLTFDLYIGQTSAATASTTWISDAGLTRVYRGTYTFSAANNGWNTIDISAANWTWDGSSNIVLAFHRTNNTAPSNTTYPNFYYTNTSNMCAYYCNSSLPVTLDGNNVAIIPEYYSVILTTERPEIKICTECGFTPTEIPTVSLSPDESQIVCKTNNVANAINDIAVTAEGGSVSISPSDKGLSYSTLTHKITGTPDFTGSQEFTVTVTDANDCLKSQKTFTITVNELNATIEFGD